MTPKPSGLPQATPRGTVTDLTPQERETMERLLPGYEDVTWAKSAFRAGAAYAREAAEAERDRLADRVEQLEAELEDAKRGHD